MGELVGVAVVTLPLTVPPPLSVALPAVELRLVTTAPCFTTMLDAVAATIFATVPETTVTGELSMIDTLAN